jgi:hypothetical protein
MELSVEEKIDYLAKTLVHQTNYIRISDINDPLKKSAYKVMLNMLDILLNNSIPQIEDHTLEISRKLGLLHLMHNRRITPDQRKVLEGWVFDNNKF